jgi:hypothetical protein
MAGDLVSIGADLYARKCRGERIDALERLAYFRLLYLRQRAAGHSLAFTEYGGLLKRAMKPVLLPPDFAVSSETAAHFNRLVYGAAA